MPRGEDTGNHPKRQVGPEVMLSGVPGRAEEVKRWNEGYAAHRAATGLGVKATRPGGDPSAHSQVTQASEWTARQQLAEDMKWDRQRGD